MKTITCFFAVFPLIISFSACKPAESVLPDGQRLYANVEKYVSFGDHRTGTPANTQTANWLGEELKKNGYEVNYPEFPVRQYFFNRAAIISGSDSISVFPQWRVNENISQSVEGRLVDITPPLVQTDLEGKIALIHAPEGEVLQAFRLIDALAGNGAVAVVVITENPSGDVAAFNATAKPDSWKIPVALVASGSSAKLADFAAKRQPVRLYIDGTYKNVKGRKIPTIQLPFWNWRMNRSSLKFPIRRAGIMCFRCRMHGRTIFRFPENEPPARVNKNISSPARIGREKYPKL